MVGVGVKLGVTVVGGIVPTLMLPGSQDDGMPIPFWSDKINPSGAAGVARVVTWELPGALPRKAIVSNVPLPCAGE